MPGRFSIRERTRSGNLSCAPAVDRLQLALDLGLGVAVSPKGFVMARIDGTGDRLDDGLDYGQLMAMVNLCWK